MDVSTGVVWYSAIINLSCLKFSQLWNKWLSQMIYRCERVRQGTGQQFVCFVTFKLLGGWSSHSPFKFASWQLPYHQPPCIRLSSSAQSLHRHWVVRTINKHPDLWRQSQKSSPCTIGHSFSLQTLHPWNIFQLKFGHKILVQSVSQIFLGENAV